MTRKKDPRDPDNHGDTGFHLGFPDQTYLRPCPFCGGTSLSMNNTHTPSYWIACHGCRCEVNGDYGPNLVGGRYGTRRQHEASRNSAIQKWNERRTISRDRWVGVMGATEYVGDPELRDAA